MLRLSLFLLLISSCGATSCPQGPICGDGVAQVSEGEECDGRDLRGLTCGVFRGYTGEGALNCDKQCVYDLSQCVPQ